MPSTNGSRGNPTAEAAETFGQPFADRTHDADESMANVETAAKSHPGAALLAAAALG